MDKVRSRRARYIALEAIVDFLQVFAWPTRTAGARQFVVLLYDCLMIHYCRVEL